MTKLITTYKEHRERPNDEIQGLGRMLAYDGLDYIYALLKDDSIYYSESLEDSIVGIESYINMIEKMLAARDKSIEDYDEFLRHELNFAGHSAEWIENKLKELKGIK